MDKVLDFVEYQQEALKTAVYPMISRNVEYPTLGLCGEAGEIANKIKKVQRDYGGLVPVSMQTDLKSELGDVLWYLAVLCFELGLSLEEVAEYNLKKLRDRQERNVLKGAGDER